MDGEKVNLGDVVYAQWTNRGGPARWGPILWSGLQAHAADHPI